MTDRFPLIVDSTTGTVKEIVTGDNLDLTSSGIVNATGIGATNISVSGITTSGRFKVVNGVSAGSSTLASVQVEGTISANVFYAKRPGTGAAVTFTAGEGTQPGPMILIENDRRVGFLTNISSVGIGSTIVNSVFYVGAGATFLSGSLCVGIGSTRPRALLDLTSSTSPSTPGGFGHLIIGSNVGEAFHGSGINTGDVTAAAPGDIYDSRSTGIGQFRRDSFVEIRGVATGFPDSQTGTLIHTATFHLNELEVNRSILRCTGYVGYGNSSLNKGFTVHPVLNVTSAGSIGINTTTPDTTYSLDIHSPIPDSMQGYTPPAGLRVRNNVLIGGSLSKGSGSFNIPHPVTNGKRLVHSFIEGPKADLIYRGTVSLNVGSAIVNIDESVGLTSGTWAALCRDPQLFLQNNEDWTQVKGEVSAEGIITITAKTSSSTTIDWMVIAERKDLHMYDTEWTDEDGRPILEPNEPTPPVQQVYENFDNES